MTSRDLGKIGSIYYLKYETITLFNTQIRENMSLQAILSLLAHASVCSLL
jgi:hypothetical protein